MRAGRRLTLNKPLPAGDYYAFISRGDRRPECDVYAWSVRQRLPEVPIPLEPPDGDVPLDLARAFAMAYDRGRYDRLVRYNDPPPPPAFEPGDAQWVSQTAGAAVK